MDAVSAGAVSTEGITPEELRLAARNHGLPLEALSYPITPAGLHYLLIHYDIPVVDPQGFRLEIGGAVPAGPRNTARKPASSSSVSQPKP